MLANVLRGCFKMWYNFCKIEVNVYKLRFLFFIRINPISDASGFILDVVRILFRAYLREIFRLFSRR